jgi:hypothetical protein
LFTFVYICLHLVTESLFSIVISKQTRIFGRLKNKFVKNGGI